MSVSTVNATHGCVASIDYVTDADVTRFDVQGQSSLGGVRLTSCVLEIRARCHLGGELAEAANDVPPRAVADAISRAVTSTIQRHSKLTSADSVLTQCSTGRLLELLHWSLNEGDVAEAIKIKEHLQTRLGD